MLTSYNAVFLWPIYVYIISKIIFGLRACAFRLKLQVCLEGEIPVTSAKRSLAEGHQPYGDQIPWKFAEQFKDTVFPSLSGARIVRIATHPSAMKVISISYKTLNEF